ncbi:31710_t:CDS:2, partial [Gigaspora margarita]
MASQNSETASNTFSVSENELQEYSETNKSSQSVTKRRSLDGKKLGDIWNYVDKGASLGQEHYGASCKWCPVKWDRGRPNDMRLHLARQCSNVPDDVKYFWRDFIVEEKTPTRKKTKYNQSEITALFQKIESIPEACVESLNKAILKAWVMYNFSFETIENPFIIDLFKLAIPGYDLPSRDKLSGCFLDQEVLKIDGRIDNELEDEANLTLSLDGWTSPTRDSVYNFIITTPKRKEYLIKLKEYNKVCHTGEFMANEILSFIEKLDVEKFAAVVTDSGANLRVARQIVHDTYPSILNIRCATHAVNLLASDFTKLDSIKDIIAKCGSILNFFHNSHIAHRYYSEQLRLMKIKGGEIKTYSKTRWGTLFTTIDSIVKSKPVFDWILENHVSVISNTTVFDLLEDEDFYIKCRQISIILKPVKELTNCLKARTANLADVFIGLVKLAASINRVENSNPWKKNIINNFNQRFDELVNPVTILAYWLHPLYRESCQQLLMEMQIWKRKNKPYHLSYNSAYKTPIMWWLSINVDDNREQLLQLALRLFSIVPSQAVCERNFSMLKWFYGDKRTRLCLSRVEDMAKIRSYYLSNSNKELQLYSKDLNNKELYESINASMVTCDLLETSDENTNSDRINNLDYMNENENLESSVLNIA